MKYVLFLCTPVGDEPGPDASADDCRFTAYAEEVRDGDLGRGGTRLRPSTDATTVRVADGEVLLSDGPFTQAEEYIAGIDIVDVADLDEALALASRHPAALTGGSVEVRPVWE